MTSLALCGLAPSLAATRVRRARNARCGAAVRVAAAAGPDGAAPATPAAAAPAASAGSCPKCGVAKGSMKCDGSGRQQGGIGALPGFGWWPIMAYRPCPALIESGGTYTKKGQDLDEVMFGKNR